MPRSNAAHWVGDAALLTAGAVGAWVAYSRLRIPRAAPLPPALPGRREILRTEAAGAVSLYGTAEPDGTPLLLIHSVNAAASAYGVRPLYQRYRGTRPVYALDLPGFGFSERSRRLYTPRLMVDAIATVTRTIRGRHNGVPLDAMAVSLSCEYLARAAVECPDDYRSLGLISPTGFDARLSGRGPRAGQRGNDLMRNAFDFPVLGRAAFDALASRRSLRHFLGKAFGSEQVDAGLIEYDYLTAHQPGAEHAVACFLSGDLFPTDATTVYEALRLPVWMVHGTRGDFVDYRDAGRFERRPNWTAVTLPTGAMPQFERLGEMTERYNAFLSSIDRGET